LLEASPIVFVVDDDAVIRSAIARLLRSVGLAVLTFASASEFRNRSTVDGPACLVLDVSRPGVSGLELQRDLAEHEPSVPIVFITGDGDIPMSVQAMKAGAVDFLPKPFRAEALLDAILEGLERSRAQRRVESELADLRHRHDALTAREREVLMLVVEGMLNKHIADELGISQGTVKIHRAHVMKKMDASSVADLVRMAARIGISESSSRLSPKA
jgi:FixJ family two-component response regulator